MATQNLRIEGDIALDKGSDLIMFIEHDSDGVLTGDKYIFPFFENSGTSKSVAQLTKTTEGGIVKTGDGATTLTKTIDLIQGNADALNITETLEGKSMAWVKQRADTTTSAGKYTVEVGAGAVISQNQSFSGNSSTTQVTLNVTPFADDLVIPLTSFADTLTQADLAAYGNATIPGGRGYKFFDVDAK